MSGTPTARVICPTCGWHRVVKRIGTTAAAQGKVITMKKGVFRFGAIPIDQYTPVKFFASYGHCSEMDRKAGKPCGFHSVGQLTLEQAIRDPNWSWVVDDIYNSAMRIVRRIDDERAKRSGSGS